MEVVHLNGLDFRPLIPAHQIRERVKEMAARINRDLKDERPLFIGVLNGAFIFAADLIKELDIECEVTFVKLSSYKGTQSTGEVKTPIGLDVDLAGRTVVILEDIVDTGKTMSQFLPSIKKLNPDRILIAVLLVKPESLEYDLEMDYIGFEVPSAFLVGYGLDYDGLGRNLKDIYEKC